MRKKLILGIMLVLTLLLLIPTISALQQNTIKDKAYNDFNEKRIDIKLGYTGVVKYPLLYVLISFITNLKLYRWLKWSSISAEIIDDNLNVTNPVIFVYSLWLLMRLTIWDNFWTFLDENFDLNWEYP